MWETTLNGEDKSLTLRSNHASKDFLSKLQDCRLSKHFTDVTLVTEDGQQITAHKLVLCGLSPYFQLMFRGSLKESEASEVLMKDVNYEALNGLIDYFYCGTLKITLENVPELLKLADLLLLENTKKYLINYLKQTLNSQNCILYKRLGQLYCEEKLMENSEEFMARNYAKVMESEDFYSLTSQEFLSFLEHYGASIIVPSEDLILHSIGSWISKDSQRQDCLPNLLQFVHWNQLSQESLDSFQKAFPYQTSIENFPMVHQNGTTARLKRKTNTKLMIGIGFDSRDVEFLDLDNIAAGWKILTRLPMRYGLSGASLATYGCKILLAGGVGAGGVLKAVNRLLVYDISTNEWSEGPPMSHARKCHGCVVKNDKLYVVGGTDSQLPVLTSEYLDLVNDLTLSPIRDKYTKDTSSDENASPWKSFGGQLSSWHNGSAGLMVLQAGLLALSVYGTDHDKLFSFENEENGEWSKLQTRDPRYSRDHPGLCTYQNQVVMVGGTDPDTRDNMKLVESYNFETWNSSLIGPMNVAREGPGVIQAEDSIWVVGGRGLDVNGSVEVYQNGEWKVQEHCVKHENQEYLLAILESN